MTAFLYKMDFESGKSYIGITKSLINRMSTHMRVARRGRIDGNCDFSAVHAAIRKYNYEFDVNILAIGDWEYVLSIENAAIKAYKTLRPHGYNVSAGGINGLRGKQPYGSFRRMMFTKAINRYIKEVAEMEFIEQENNIYNTNKMMGRRVI